MTEIWRRAEKSAQAVRKAMRLGAETIAEIAAATGLSRPQVGRWVKLMVESGEVEIAATKPGQHPYGAGNRVRIYKLTDTVRRDPLVAALIGRKP